MLCDEHEVPRLNDLGGHFDARDKRLQASAGRSRLSYGAKCFLSAWSLTAPTGLPLKVAALMMWTVGMTVTLNSYRAFRPVTSAHPALRIPQRRGLRGGPRTRS